MSVGEWVVAAAIVVPLWALVGELSKVAASLARLAAMRERQERQGQGVDKCPDYPPAP